MTDTELTTRPVIERQPASPTLPLTTTAAALMDGLPLPVAVHLDLTRGELRIHTNTAADWEAWRRWWNSRDAGPWVTTREQVDTAHHSSTHHHTRGHWRGWTVVILRVDLEEAP